MGAHIVNLTSISSDSSFDIIVPAKYTKSYLCYKNSPRYNETQTIVALPKNTFSQKLIETN